MRTIHVYRAARNYFIDGIYWGGLGHITVDTGGNLQFHIFLLARLILKDLQETGFILPHEVSSREAFIFSYL
jgi:hypothetical protein